MRDSFEQFLALCEQERKDIFEKVAEHLRTEPIHIEKDFWACLLLNILYNRLPDNHPQLIFKGGTSLTKAFNLIQRFSEDIDLVVCRKWLGYEEENDPTSLLDFSQKRRKKLLKALKMDCSNYICNDLAPALRLLLDEKCSITVDEDDDQTLLIGYPALYPNTGGTNTQPFVKLEAGAFSALTPSIITSIKPYICEELSSDWSFEVPNLHVIKPSRTYLDKLMILHGAYCGYRDENRLPTNKDRMSRHYYDVAMITDTQIGRDALLDQTLLTDVRERNQTAFKKAWAKLNEAVPGSLHLVPQEAVRNDIERDYQNMRDMIIGDAPSFGWVIEQLQIAEDIFNQQ